MIGVYVAGIDARATVEAIRLAEEAGVPAVWLTMGRVSPDPSVVFGAAAMVTERVKLGTSIVPTWPRHPVALAQEAIAVASLAPGRFRLGIGPSAQQGMEQLFGVEWRTPLTQLREYLVVLRTLLSTGRVDFAGRHVKTRARLDGGPVDVPVLASALREASFRACGELSDGAISWMCPWPYLKDVALPALAEGAAKGGRAAPPPLIVHVPVCLSEDREEVRAVAREQLGRYATVGVYQAMFAAAGYADLSRGYPDALVDALVASGSEGEIMERLETLLNEGAGEVIVHPLTLGANETAYREAVYDLVARANVEAGVSAYEHD